MSARPRANPWWRNLDLVRANWLAPSSLRMASAFQVCVEALFAPPYMPAEPTRFIDIERSPVPLLKPTVGPGNALVTEVVLSRARARIVSLLRRTEAPW